MAKIIDAHIHFGDDDPGLLELLELYDIRLLNICFAADFEDDWRAQRQRYRKLAGDNPERFAWCTTIDLPRVADESFDAESYVSSAIESLAKDFESGAVACKLWKNIGMSIRKQDGSFLYIDDELFTPIFEYLAVNDHTLLIHMAEPLACWQPLDERSPHYDYYRTHPQWHMFNHPEYPSHSELIAARDRMVERNANLRVVGAHLASLEYDVDEVAKRLDRYPNLAVDTSARLGDLAMQDSAKVREFIVAYQDRILFGTDVVMQTPPSAMSEQDRCAALDELRSVYDTHFAYFGSGDPVAVRNIKTMGLNLPSDVLDKLCRDNALRWYPALTS